MKFFITLCLFFLSFTLAYSQMGYQRDPWGGSKYTGPGAPPHWSPEAQYRYKRMQQDLERNQIRNDRLRKKSYRRPKPEQPIYRPPALKPSPDWARYPAKRWNPGYRHWKSGMKIYHPYRPGYRPGYGRTTGISIGIGAGGWFIYSGSWYWHDRRIRGYTYYTRRIQKTKYIYVDNQQHNTYNTTTTVNNRPAPAPARQSKLLCSDAPTYSRSKEGVLTITFDKPPTKCD